MSETLQRNIPFASPNCSAVLNTIRGLNRNFFRQIWKSVA